jgi:hypothetical protein
MQSRGIIKTKVTAEAVSGAMILFNKLLKGGKVHAQEHIY